MGPRLALLDKEEAVLTFILPVCEPQGEREYSEPHALRPELGGEQLRA